jgi:hypothetical protein
MPKSPTRVTDMKIDRELRLPELSFSKEPASPHAYRIADICKATGLGRTSIYAAIKSGALIARRYGRCTLVLADDLAAFLRDLPQHR